MSKDFLNKCIFCNRISDLEKNREWYDFFVIKDYVNFVIVIPLGCLVPGYLLLVSKRHILSLSYLYEYELEELSTILTSLTDKIEQIWSKPIIVEHGTGTINGTSGSSISHAHLHFLPLGFNIENLDNYTIINGLHQIKDYKDKDYQLYINTRGEYFIRIKNNLPSQYYRRLAANSLGMPEKWNYKDYPFYKNMKDTLRIIEYL